MRLADGGTHIDRTREVRFTFDGVPLTGFATVGELRLVAWTAVGAGDEQHQ